MITGILFIVTAVLVSAVCFLTGALGLAGALLLCIGIFAFEHLLYLIVFELIACPVPMDKPLEKQSRPCYWSCSNVGSLLSFYFGVHAEVIGTEKIPTDSRFLFVSNHRSLFDPLITIDKLRDYNIPFISKPSNMKIPIVGHVIYAAGCLGIDRENNRNALKTIQTATDYIKRDLCSMGIYPEGTRSKTMDLLPFHSGSFKIAQKARVPIVVASISGTEKINRSFLFAPKKVTLTILEVIPAETVLALKTVDLSDHARSLIEADLQAKE